MQKKPAKILRFLVMTSEMSTGQPIETFVVGVGSTHILKNAGIGGIGTLHDYTQLQCMKD